MDDITEIANKLSSAAGTLCTGYLKNGRYYFTAERWYAITKPIEIRFYATDELAPTMDSNKVKLTINFDVEYHTLHSDYESIGQEVRRRLDESYKDYIKQHSEQAPATAPAADAAE